MTIKRFVSLLCLFLFLSGCSALTNCDNTHRAETCPRVLFIGNSYTYVNDLPNTFAELSRLGGHQVETGMAAPGGWFLSDHVKSADTINKINSTKWDFVVLQEQSQTPASASARSAQMYPAARTLVQTVRANGATPIFFITWAHRDGWPEAGLPNYSAMQLQINAGYLAIARELNAPVAPVGEAWTMLSGNPQFDLWQADGSHPTTQGTYLAACVFYAAIFHQSPEGLAYTDGLSKDIAGTLQTIAAHTVLGNPAQWNLPQLTK
jgi:hypothetical protein